MKKFNIDKMRTACQAASKTLDHVGTLIKPGMTSDDINVIVHNHTLAQGGYPAPLNYRGFPKSVCVSVNSVACHGIPGSQVLKAGDIVNVDVTTIVDGHFGDTNHTFFVGTPHMDVRALVLTTWESMHLFTFPELRPGILLNRIGQIIQGYAEHQGYNVVREFGGHGIGTRFHMTPHVSHFDTKDDNIILKPGMIFTIEPILSMGARNVYIADDGWTVLTVDGSWTAQFEHTVLITDNGYEILTKGTRDEHLYENYQRPV